MTFTKIAFASVFFMAGSATIALAVMNPMHGMISAAFAVAAAIGYISEK